MAARISLTDAADAAPRIRRLADYRPSDWLVDETELDFILDPKATRVRARLTIRRNPATGDGPRPDLQLDGRGLTPLTPTIDGQPLADAALTVDAEGLRVAGDALPSDRFVWSVETVVDPSANTALEGLYMSNGMYCTQCEAQGFRKITYALDRPDVMSVYTVRIDGDAESCPILLSNGNFVSTEPAADGRSVAVWRDPFPKPSYLFALVAGVLTATEDRFVTSSGREIALALFTRPGDEDKTAYAMDALKRSMAWDEEVYGREYDLDQFMIVAVDDFNMGAMENKGLNIFNSKFVLASPETATDFDYENIERIVAHEYFHNWTGNRITCRDWFQLCLKEGLTVFRDQQFGEDMRSAAVSRIERVKALRARQFREDAGPLAHPVRPESYIEINNFYTSTVYEKGSEIVRMLQTICGPEAYRAALDLYFERHDGEACTIEQFRACFEAVTGRDLSAFARWWSQAGTPHVSAEIDHDPITETLTLELSQSTAPTPGQAEKTWLPIPIRFGLIDRAGADLGATVSAEPGPGASLASHDPSIVVLEADRAQIRFGGIAERPAISLNRGFTAPIVLDRPLVDGERPQLLAHDADPFARWEIGRDFALDALVELTRDIAAGRTPRDLSDLVDAIGATLTDDRLDPAFRALAATPPGEEDVAAALSARLAAEADADAPPRERPGVDPDAVHAARAHLRVALAERLAPIYERLYDEHATPGPYRPIAEDAGKRALRNAAMAALAHGRSAEAFARAEAQFRNADNMTERMPALTALVHCGAPTAADALQSFYDAWRDDALVLDKWFVVQATSPLDDAFETVLRLTRHDAFDWRNPNRFRSLIAAFAMANPVGFHRRDGAGYRLLADWLIKLDASNPQTAARVAGAFDSWARLDARRRGLVRAELDRIAAAPALSKDLAEMIGRLRAIPG